MSGYLIWIVGTAIMTVTILTVGTLAAAGMLTREKGRPDLSRHRTPAARAIRRDRLLTRAAPAPIPDIVEEWGLQSFPASDAPANW